MISWTIQFTSIHLIIILKELSKTLTQLIVFTGSAFFSKINLSHVYADNKLTVIYVHPFYNDSF